MVATVGLSSFASGEVSPSFWGHFSHQKFAVACSTLRNCFVSIRGGAYSRAGTKYVGKAKQAAAAGSVDPRITSFQFNVKQGYILEWGDKYVRFIANGGYITETPIGITAASQANPLTVTVPGHNFAVNDWIYIAGAGGMIQIDGLVFVITGIAGNVLTLADVFGVPVN